MNYPKRPEYRFDLSGEHPDNLILNERILVDPDFPVIAFKHSPFYMTSVTLTNVRGEPLEINKDFEFFKLDKELSTYTGKEVGSLIKLINPVKTTIYASYRTVGSIPLFNETLKNIYDSIATREDSVYWLDITNRPVLFTPKLHFHDATYNLYGFKDLASNVADLISWFVPEITYNRDNLPKFTPYELITGKGELIKANLGTNPLLNIKLNVPSDYNALTMPSPHLDFFIQVVKNATRYINNYVNSYIAQLNEHIKANNNTHGVNAEQVQLGLRDNFKVNTLATDSTDQPYSDKRLVTPAWFAQLAKSTKGRTDNYVEKDGLPLARFGDNSYIPPIIDSNVNGLGIKYAIAVACLERGGWISVLLNAKDTTSDFLTYLKIVRSTRGDEVSQTRFKYAPTDPLVKDVQLDTVMRGGDYRWMVVGDSKNNKWFLVKTNGTLDPSKHQFYPISFPVAFSGTDYKYKYMSMAVVSGPNNVDKYIHFYHRNTTLEQNSRLRSTMMRLDISALNATSNVVSFLNLPTVNNVGTTVTLDNGGWEPFPYILDANNKVTQWMTKFPTPVDSITAINYCLHHYFYDANNKDFYLRIQFIADIVIDGFTKSFICSVVQKYVQNADGSFTKSTVKGNPDKVLNTAVWDKTKSTNYIDHINDSVNLPFMDEFLDNWPVNGIGNDFNTSNSKLADGSWFSLRSIFGYDYPVSYSIMEKDQLDLDQLTSFTTGKVQATVTGNYVTSKPIVNEGPTGLISGLSGVSVVGDTNANPTYEYEISRTSLGDGGFKHLARKITGAKTKSFTDAAAVKWLGSEASTDIRVLDIPELSRYLHWVDDRNTDNKGRAQFSVVSGTTTGLSEEIGPRTVSFAHTVDITSDPNKVKVKETRRLRFTENCIKNLLGQVNAAAVYGGTQVNWNIYWFPNNGTVIQPILIVYWINVTDAGKSLMMSVVSINQTIDPLNDANYVKGEDGVLEIVYDSGNVNIIPISNVTTVKVSDLPSYVDNTYWINEAPVHQKHGSTYVYCSATKEVSVFGSSTVFLALSADKSQSNAISPSFAIKMNDLATIASVQSLGNEYNKVNGETITYKGIGILTNYGLSSEDFAGGVVIPARLAGKTFAEWQTNALKGNDGVGMYYISDIALANSFKIYVVSPNKVILNGGSYDLSPVTINLADVKANPANTTFYLYLELTAAGAVITPKLSPVTDTSTLVYLGTAVTDGTKVSSIKVSPVFTMNGFRISEVQQGASIPASTGDINTAGTFNWGTS